MNILVGKFKDVFDVAKILRRHRGWMLLAMPPFPLYPHYRKPDVLTRDGYHNSYKSILYWHEDSIANKILEAAQTQNLGREVIRRYSVYSTSSTLSSDDLLKKLASGLEVITVIEEDYGQKLTKVTFVY